MSAAASRAVLRHSRFAVRRTGVRNASSTTEAAREKVAAASSKASEGLSKVASSAGATLSKVGSATAGALGNVGSATAGALGNVGGRTGRLIGGVQALIPRVVFYSKVGLELGKLVAQQRAMAPPNMATVESYFQPLLNALRNPMTLLSRTAESSAVQPANILSRVRNMSRAQWMSTGVIAAEVIGFFSVGEMLGRFKIVGYRSSAPAHH